MSDFELTSDEKQQVISQRRQEYKARRYNAQVTLELAEMLDNDDPFKKQQVDQAQQEIVSLEKLLSDLQGIEDGVVASDGNRAARRRAARTTKPVKKASEATKD